MKGLKTLIAVLALVPVAAVAQVNRYEHNQHKRIVQGVRHGSLTRWEAARLRAREARIRAQERAMRFRHSGHLTPAERARLDRELRHTSRDIHRQKHDWQHRPH